MAEVSIKTGDVEIKVSDQRESAEEASQIAKGLWIKALDRATEENRPRNWANYPVYIEVLHNYPVYITPAIYAGVLLLYPT